MKKLLLISLLACTASGSSYAQASFNTMDSIDVNNITANMLVHGDMMWNPVDYSIPGCQYPAHSNKFINFASAIWVSGFDGAGQLHLSAQTYRQGGNDYWPGPLDTSDTLTYTTSQNWAKIWKVNRSDIQYFQSLSTHTTINTPQAILTWPGKGSLQAQGNAGIPIVVNHEMAPFVDINGNGIYEPLLGEYPDIKGDQALWWIFSDNGPTHTFTNGKPLGIEIQAMAYGYHRNTLIDNVVYFEYICLNSSANTYNNARIAWFDDAQISYYLDNYVGFDSVWRMGITYKGTNDDIGLGGYGLNPPISGVTAIVLPYDAGSTYVPPGSFTYYNNDASLIGNPTIDTEYNNYMRAKIRNGQHFTNDYSGPGIPSVGYGFGPDCNYVFNGDPSVHAQWSECSANNSTGDRRFVLSSNDFTLPPGGSQRVVFAFLVADTLAGGCPSASFDGIGIVADTAWANYFNPPLPNAVKNIAPFESVTIYPNPAHDNLFIDNNGKKNAAELIFYNSLGQIVDIPLKENTKGCEADLSHLPQGLYYIKYRTNSEQKTLKFIRE